MTSAERRGVGDGSLHSLRALQLNRTPSEALAFNCGERKEKRSSARCPARQRPTAPLQKIPSLGITSP